MPSLIKSPANPQTPRADAVQALEPAKRATIRAAGGNPASPADDGTRALLQSGFWIVLLGILALVATKTLFGGIGIHGASTNAGWLSLMFALMGLPFGLMLLLLGVAKWLRNRRQARLR